MARDYKGNSVNKYINDYCVVDLETTGVFISSAKIVELSAIKVRGGIVVNSYSTLVNPQCHIPAAATAVNHITDEMVKDAPTLNAVLDSFLDFVDRDVIIGYNNSGFDMNLLYDKAMDLRGIPFSNDYIDVLHAARRCLSDVANYKLETICTYYGLDTVGEHRALKDCFLTKDCYDRLYADFGKQMFSRRSSGSGTGSGKIRFSAETLALQDLQSMLEKTIEDGIVTHAEFAVLQGWVEEHRYLQGIYPFDRVFNALDKVLEDGRVSSEELETLQFLFADFVDPVKARSCHDSIDMIENKHICVTGEFLYGDRRDVLALIEKAGGIIDKSVKKCTDYVVVGAYGSENWKTGNYGSKIQKALQWNDKGADIKIIEEKEFITAVKRIIEERQR